MASAVAALQADVVEAPTPFAPIGEAANAGQVQAAARRAFSSSEAEWLSRLDGIQPTPSRRRVDFLDSCSDIDVSWSLNKVLLARMKVEVDSTLGGALKMQNRNLAQPAPNLPASRTSAFRTADGSM